MILHLGKGVKAQNCYHQSNYNDFHCFHDLKILILMSLIIEIVIRQQKSWHNFPAKYQRDKKSNTKYTNVRQAYIAHHQIAWGAYICTNKIKK